MDNTTKSEGRNQVPLQRSTAVWLDEPGYGGTNKAWENFDLAISEQLKAFEEKHPSPRRIPASRPR